MMPCTLLRVFECLYTCVWLLNQHGCMLTGDGVISRGERGEGLDIPEVDVLV